MARLSSVENKGQEVREENFSEKETQGQLLTVENDFYLWNACGSCL